MKSVVDYMFRRLLLNAIPAIFLVLFILPAKAQYKLRLVLSNIAPLHQNEPVYVAGNFNNWNPGSDAHQLKKENKNLVIEIENIPAAVYEFKFTRGSWSKAACNLTGNDVENNVVVLSSDTIVSYNIEAWKDDFEVIEKKHTASDNVKIIDTAFYMPQLNRSRKLMIYLPEGYEKSSKRYPVLYMHDGQNVFDEHTSGYGEWGVDESLDSLIKKGKKACIVVAIENGPRRLNEYNPFYFERFGEGEGEAYVNFLTETLKPFIDSQYRTLVNEENTIIAGSSMGGLISYYACLKRPDVFGKAGIFSPAFWTADSIKIMTDSLGNKMKGMYFFYMGGLEGETYLADMLGICDKLGRSSSGYLYTAIDPEGLHNEKAWRKWFAEFYQWITADGNNYIIKTSD